MSLYRITVKRCHHIKVNGMQCNSPSLRESTHCYYHIRYHWPELVALPDNSEWRKHLPTLEDANSIQVSLANVMERLLLQEVDHKTAALLLYALQTASMNLKRTSLEPALPTQVVIDRASVANRPIGATAWSRLEGREYDDLCANDLPENDLHENDLHENDLRENDRNENDRRKEGHPPQPMESIVRQSLGKLAPKALRGSEQADQELRTDG